MSETPIVHYVGRRQPPLFGTLATDVTGGDALPAGATVKFRMREVSSSTLKVDTAAVVVSEPLNQVRYDWAATDVDTAATYVGWWNVTISGQDQDTPEFLIEMRAHAPLPGQYVSLEQVKQGLNLGGESYRDAEIMEAIPAASRIVDSITGRTFGPPVTETRTFTPYAPNYLYVGDVSTITAVSMNGTPWTSGTHYYLDGGDTLRTLSLNRFTVGAQLVTVTATFGFATIPPEVAQATRIIATQLVRRVSEAPFGVLATSLDGPSIRLGRFDPQVDALLAEYTRSFVVQ